MTQVVLWGLLLIVLVGLGATVMVFLARKVMPTAERKEGEVEAIGFVFAVVGVLYAIVLAFVVIDVWTKMTATEENVYREASALVEEYRYAQNLPDPQRQEIQLLAREYANHVVNSEWPQMRKHNRVGLEGYALLDKLRSAVERSRPPVVGTAGDSLAEAAAQDAYAYAVSQGDLIAQSRETRLAAASAGVPSVLWFVLLGGGLMMVGFAYVFDIAGVATQIVLAIGLTVMTVLLLWSIYEMEYPFARQLRIDPDAFNFAMMRFIQISTGG
ncbi:MAG TPA: hypothetical protein DGG94_14525 [Micromonosporaceae bacterium]|nr:hypothetical protein [Micromonosporaceae bacterium]